MCPILGREIEQSNECFLTNKDYKQVIPVKHHPYCNRKDMKGQYCTPKIKSCKREQERSSPIVIGIQLFSVDQEKEWDWKSHLNSVKSNITLACGKTSKALPSIAKICTLQTTMYNPQIWYKYLTSMYIVAAFFYTTDKGSHSTPTNWALGGHSAEWHSVRSRVSSKSLRTKTFEAWADIHRSEGKTLQSPTGV